MRKKIIAALAVMMVLLFSATALAQSVPGGWQGENKKFEMRDKNAPGTHKKGGVTCPPEIQALREKFVKDNEALLQKIREGNKKLMALKQRARNGELNMDEQASLERIREIEKELFAQKKAMKDVCLALKEKPKAKELARAKEQVLQIQKEQLRLLNRMLPELERIS